MTSTTATEARYAPSDFAPPSALAQPQRMAAIVGAVAALACAVGAVLDPAQFFRSYLVGYLYILGFPMGCLALAMLHHVTKGAWGVVIRRILEAATRTLPFMVILFIPVIVGMKELFVWTDPEVLAHDDLIAGKTPYLNVTFFLIRAVIIFGVWGILAFFLNRWSLQQDETGDNRLSLRMQGLSGAGIGLYVLTASFASFDWLMSLDPHWFSSIYGVYFVGGQALTAMAFVIPVALFLSRQAPMDKVFRPSHFQDYGKLMLAFTMLWAYFSLSQFLIIWSGNLPEDVSWYMTRTAGKWLIVAQAIMFLHFGLPFLLLLNTDIKRSARRLSIVAGLILVMRWVDLYWQAAPAMKVAGLHWMDVVMPLALGGLWLWVFFWQLARRPLLPVHEPFLKEALHHE